MISPLPARDILLFTLIVDEGYPENASQLWNIFYHFFLDDGSNKLLVSQSTKLARLSVDMESWNASEYSAFLRISSRSTLYELNRLWTLYATTATLSQAKKKQMRQSFVAGMKAVALDQKDSIILTAGRSAGPLFLHAMQQGSEAHRHFWTTGLTSESQEEATRAVHVNSTFAYTAQTEGFPAHYGTSPLPPFHLARSFPPSASHAQPRRSTPTIFDLFRDAQAQFRSWCDSARASFSRPGGTVVLRFLVGDVLAVCHTLQAYANERRVDAAQHLSPWDARRLLLDSAGYDAASSNPAPRRFNVIDTSNLSDHIGMLNILIATIPLLQRHPAATLLTETLLSMGDDPLKSFTSRMCGDPSTVFTLLDLAPSSYVSGFTTQSNTHEVLYYSTVKVMDKNPRPAQYHERMTWKLLSLDCGEQPILSTDPAHLSAILFDIYNRMFAHENAATIYQNLSLASITDRSAVHYCRRSLALLIRYLMGRIATDWDQVLDKLFDSIASSATLLSVSMNHYQDLLCHLYMLGLHTEDSWTPGSPYMLKNKDNGRFSSWSEMPSVVSVVFSVPREKLKILDDKQSPINALIQCGIWGPTFANAFTHFQSAFGAVTTVGEGEATQIVVVPDPQGKQGSSDFVVAFWIPTWTLCNVPHETQVTLEVVSTPMTMPLAQKLGLTMRLYAVPLMDSQQVLISASAPRFSADAVPATSARTPTRPHCSPAALTPTLDMDPTSLRLTSMKVHVDIVDPAVKALLADRETSVVANPGYEPGSVILSIGGKTQQTLQFSPLADVSAPKLKVARKSSWVEVRLLISSAPLHQ